MLVRCLHCSNVLDMRDVPVHAAVVCPKGIAIAPVAAPRSVPVTIRVPVQAAARRCSTVS